MNLAVGRKRVKRNVESNCFWICCRVVLRHQREYLSVRSVGFQKNVDFLKRIAEIHDGIIILLSCSSL